MNVFRKVLVGVCVTALPVVGLGVTAAGASTLRAADTVTFTSAQVGTSGNTAQFTQTGNWQMAWTYDCASFGSSGNFNVNVNQPSGDLATDAAPNELGMSGSGTDYYYDTGAFSLSVTSECTWSITVSPSAAGTSAGSASFSSSQTGTTGQTSQFTESGAWSMAWSYNCASFGSSGNFNVNVNQPSGDLAFDQGPNELGTSGSGTDHYSDTGTFSLEIDSECQWTINVSPEAATTAPPPSPTPTAGSGCNMTLQSGTVVGMAATPDGRGYWIASSTGAVAACGDAPDLGIGPAGTAAIAAAPSGTGYWLVTGSGAVAAFGSAVNHGSIPAGTQLAKPIVAMAADPATGGYWLLGGDGGVFSYDAPFYGSTGNIHLAQPAVGMESTLDGKGYRFVAADGGIFDYGDAAFYGSTGNIHLNKPVVGMAIDPATGGYWLDASDGGIFSFNAPFHGSTGNIALAQPCVGMTAMPDGGGYRFVAADGGIFDFGNAPFEGSAAG